MDFIKFFKNTTKRYQKKNFMKLISDLTLKDIFTLGEFNNTIRYRAGERIILFDETLYKYMVLIAVRDTGPGDFNPLDWSSKDDVNTNQVTMAQGASHTKTYIYTTKNENETVIYIPKTDFKFGKDVFIVSINSTIVTPANYTINDNGTITFTSENYINIPKDVQIKFIFFSSYEEVDCGKNEIMEVLIPNFNVENKYLYTFNVDSQTNTTKFELPSFYHPLLDSLFIFDTGVLLQPGINYINHLNNSIELLYPIVEDGHLIKCIIVHYGVQFLSFGEQVNIVSREDAVDGIDDTSAMTPAAVNAFIENILGGYYTSQKSDCSPDTTDRVTHITPNLVHYMIDNVWENYRSEVIANNNPNVKIYAGDEPILS